MSEKLIKRMQLIGSNPSNRQANQSTMHKEKEELLEKAISLILDLTEDDPEAMCEVIRENEGQDYCANNCNNFGRECLLKYLKYYEKP